MTDEETLARLRASSMSPGDFLHELETLEDTQDMPPVFPPATADEFAAVRQSRDTWRWACVILLVGYVLAALAGGMLVGERRAPCIAPTAAEIHNDTMQLQPTEIRPRSLEVYEL